ncbi:MAG: hypothetical protein K9N09_03730 [Candidatus Cloacimonetes bacterium]|nr:hypothetical protein [Candidatus Cloacimonadota bacterium]MCF7813723.1 hypothetical protein [Candidatus Cloacimonadota bacterium]MCF7867789.1 hypothetical protein [Candidatus Cloacimonadota bacterium]MCF7883233.1 hypothetical protein [Candidatus Cloacimonadota bacterium]
MLKIISIIVLVLIIIPLFSEVVLNHDPIQTIQKGKKINIRLDVREGIEQIAGVTMFYRQQGEIVYNEMEQDMTSVTQPYFEFIIKNTDDMEAGLEYFFQVRKSDETVVSLPEFNPESSPFLITIIEPEQQFMQEKFILLSPDPEYTDFSKDFIIAISFFSIQNNIDLSSVKFYLNDKDRTDQAEIYKNLLIYKVSGLFQGKYNYQVKANLKNGTEIKSEIWRMSIVEKSWKTDINLRGKSTVSTYYSKQNYENDDDTDKRANYLLMFQGKYKWLGFKSKIYLSSLETHKAQPVNRYNIAFMTKYFDLTAGDLSPNYGTFLLSGTNVRGVHTNLHFRNFRMKFTGGQSNRAVDGDFQYDAGTFATNTYSLRTEFGRPDAVMWSLGFSKNKDDIASIDEDYVIDADSSYVVEPQDNIVLGSDVSFALFKRRLLMGAEVAMSYLNRNIYEGTMSIEDIEAELDTELDLPFDPEDLEPILVINENLEPYTPSLKNLAYKTYLRAFFYRNFLNINYSAVGGSFNSLSSNYLQTDTSVLGINDNINLWKNKVNLNLSLNLIADNLNDEKDYTTKTSNYNSQLFYRATSDLNFRLSYSMNTTARSGSSNLGDANSSIISFGTSYDLNQFKTAPTRLSFNFMQYANDYSYTNEANNDTTDYVYSKNNFILSANSEWESLPLETEISFTLSVEDKENAGETEENSFNSIYLKGIYSLLEDTLKPYCDLKYDIFGGDQDKSSTLFNVGAYYQVFIRTFLSTNLGVKLFKDNEIEDGDYTTLTWRFKIVQKF